MKIRRERRESEEIDTQKNIAKKSTIKVQTLPLTSAAVRRKTASPSLLVAGRRKENARERKKWIGLKGKMKGTDDGEGEVPLSSRAAGKPPEGPERSKKKKSDGGGRRKWAAHF